MQKWMLFSLGALMGVVSLLDLNAQENKFDFSKIGLEPPSMEEADLLGMDSQARIKDSYIVVFRKKTDSAGRALAKDIIEKNGGKIRHTFTKVLDGFAVTLPEKAVQLLKRSKAVAYIEADQTAKFEGTQSSAPWGLDRLDQNALPLNSSYNYTMDGSGVHVYIVDSGIYADHQDFKDRVGTGYNSVTKDNTTNDCFGHGTHVAGIIGGSTYGVAKKVTLHSVKVLASCEGTTSSTYVLAGLEWIIANAQKPAIVNVSMGLSSSQTVDDAVKKVITAGITVVAAAGNSNIDACTVSPARLPEAITVGSTDKTDTKVSTSNYGSCLDVFAPGNNILSAGISSNTASATMSGTSMAAPAVTGVAALHLGKHNNITPTDLAQYVATMACTGKVKSAGTGSTDRLATTGACSSPAPAECTGCKKFSGKMSSTGQLMKVPTNSIVTSTTTTFKAYLRDVAYGSDFDLYLYKADKATGKWVSVYRANMDPTSNEAIVTEQQAGTYAWGVYAYYNNGTGDFTLYYTP